MMKKYKKSNITRNRSKNLKSQIGSGYLRRAHQTIDSGRETLGVAVIFVRAVMARGVQLRRTQVRDNVCEYQEKAYGYEYCYYV